jgi:16S rRNA (adenine1518-N6/adenine1519-N6)-dimethyltransferase
LDLTRPSELKPLLERHGLALQKRFGQNFLISRVHLERIVEAAGLTETDTVLEIGPGAGALTVELARRAGHVTSIELDRSLFPLLGEVLTEHPNVTLLQGDALQLPLPAATHVVANIPYNITSPLLVRLLSHQPAFQSLTLLVQKEVAQRLSAPPNTPDYGALTVFVNYYASVRIAVHVPRGAFLPPPKVDSAAIHLTIHPTPPVEVPSADALFTISRAAFGQRRKTIANALSAGLGQPRESVESALDQAGIDPQRRGETLSLSEFAAVARAAFDKRLALDVE